VLIDQDGSVHWSAFNALAFHSAEEERFMLSGNAPVVVAKLIEECRGCCGFQRVTLIFELLQGTLKVVSPFEVQTPGK
jgi:hypothetical protein